LTVFPDEKPFAEGELPTLTQDCGSSSSSFPLIQCLFVCVFDKDCLPIGFDRTKIGCACSCQLCPNNLIYSAGIQDHTTAPLLSLDQIVTQCPHVNAPCNS
jgi:hypothetical protein